MLRNFNALILFALVLNLNAQDSYNKILGKEIITELSSKDYFGRGYVNDGHIKAAGYIAEKFKEYQILPLDSSFIQNFTIPVVYFPKSPVLKINRKRIKPGFEYIIQGHQATWIANYSQKGKNPLRIDTQPKLSKSPRLVTVEQLPPVAYSGTFKPDSCIYVLKSSLPKKIRKVSIDINPKIDSQLLTQNIIGYVEGEIKDTFNVVCAHYDHLGAYGEACYFPGSHDNASGVALMLITAKHLIENKIKPRYTTYFIAFGAEEVGLKGSSYFVGNNTINMAAIRQVYNLDLMGSGKEGITVVNNESNEKLFRELIEENEVKKWFPKIVGRKNAPNSDHYPFSQVNVPAFFFYTLGEVKEYHNVYDNINNVTLSKWDELLDMMIYFLK